MWIMHAYVSGGKLREGICTPFAVSMFQKSHLSAFFAGGSGHLASLDCIRLLSAKAALVPLVRDDVSVGRRRIYVVAAVLMVQCA